MQLANLILFEALCVLFVRKFIIFIPREKWWKIVLYFARDWKQPMWKIAGKWDGKFVNKFIISISVKDQKVLSIND
jgi:hypothetical protein